jgi:hypothetical protein
MEITPYEGQIYLPIAVRALTQNRIDKRKGGTNGPTIRWRETILVFDTETEIGPAQRLNFGSYWWGYPDTLKTIDEGFLYADDLSARYPEGLECLKQYAAGRKHSFITGNTATLQFRSRREFVEKMFYPAAYKTRALVVGFNLPFDISRLAVDSGLARGGSLSGGFSFTLSDYKAANGQFKEHLYRPRICVKFLDRRRSFIGFKKPSRTDPNFEHFPGYFLDLKTLGFALTNQSGSLETMCETFAVEHKKLAAQEHGRITDRYIEYNLRDLLATFELFQKLRADFDLHPIDLEPYKTFSPASIGKKYLLGMNAIPPAKKFCAVMPSIKAKAISAFFGGRAECRIRGIVPVIYVDFLSMYPSVNSLLGLWKLLTANAVKVVDVTQEIHEMLACVTKDKLFSQEFWKQLNCFAQIRPDHDLLPTRTHYDESSDSMNIGITELTSHKPLFFALPDLVASCLLSGKPPKVERAIRLVPVGIQLGLRAIRLRGAVTVDPVRQDFFQAVVEEKQRAKKDGRKSDESFLKVLANSTGYGIFAEMNRRELSKPETITVHGPDGHFEHRTKTPETPGEFCFPPIAALIASAARLKLALLERCVADEGAHYASCDTDSMTIVATEDGGPVPIKVGEGKPYRVETITALSWVAVDRIIKQFEAFNPYDKSIVPGSILKLEDENFTDKSRSQRRQLYGCFIATKRSALYNVQENGEINIRKCSELGLGHLLNPTDSEDQSRKWIEEFWRQIILEELDRPAQRPEWFDRPAISQQTISSPRLLKPFLTGKKRKAYADRMKPMNFLITAQVALLGHPAGVDPKKCHIVAPYSPDPRQWQKTKWFDIYSGKSFRISTKVGPSPSIVRVKSIQDVYEEYKTHPESKSDQPDRNVPCGSLTRGVLRRRSVHAAYVKLIGKEANNIEAIEHGEIHDLDEVLEEYADPAYDPWFTLVIPVLQRMTRAQLAKIAGITERAIQALRNARWMPSKKTRAALTHAAGDYARKQLERGIRDDLCACSALINALVTR